MGDWPANSAAPIERVSIRRNLAHMASSQLFTWMIATVVSIVVPRFVGPGDLGDLRLAASLWAMAATVAALGTSQYVQLSVARSAADGLRLVGPVLVLRTVGFVACAGLLAVYLTTMTPSRQFVVIMVILGVATLVNIWAEALGSFFIGLERVSVPALTGAGSRLVNLGGVVTVLLLGSGVVGVVGVGLATSALALVFLWWNLSRISRSRAPVDVASLRRLAQDSATFMAAGVALVVYQQIDLVVISWVADREDLGWYGAADTLFGSLLFPATVVVAVTFPTLGRLHLSDPAALQRLVSRTFCLLALVGVPVGLGTMLVARDFAPMLYGEDFRETGVVLAVLGPVLIVTFGTILFGSVALATGRGRLWVGVLLGAAALTVPLDMLLVPWAESRWDNGALGGAIAYVVTEGLQLAICVAVVAPYLRSTATVRRLARTAASGGVMFLAVWPLRTAPMVLQIIVGVTVYGVAVLVFRALGEDERALLRQLRRRLS